jgi:hypothetical protein
VANTRLPALFGAIVDRVGSVIGRALILSDQLFQKRSFRQLTFIFRKLLVALELLCRCGAVRLPI